MKWHRFVPTMLIVGVFCLGSAIVQPVSAQVVQDQVSGSLLVYALFDAHTSGPNVTKLRVTNLASVSVRVNITLVCGGVSDQEASIGSPFFPPVANEFCATTNREVSLTGGQTNVYTVTKAFTSTADTDLFPPSGCQEGFALVWAIDATGAPIAFNNLIGSLEIFYGAGAGGTPVEATNAIAFRSPKSPPQGTVLGTIDPVTLHRVVSFGGATPDYEALPLMLFGDFAAINATLTSSAGTPPVITRFESATNLILIDLNLLLTAETNRQANAIINFYDHNENLYSGDGWQFVCFARVPLDLIDPVVDKALGAFTDYGNIRLAPNPTSRTNPGILAAIEEISTAGAPSAPGTVIGATLRTLFHGLQTTINTVVLP